MKVIILYDGNESQECANVCDIEDFCNERNIATEKGDTGYYED